GYTWCRILTVLSISQIGSGDSIACNPATRTIYVVPRDKRSTNRTHGQQILAKFRGPLVSLVGDCAQAFRQNGIELCGDIVIETLGRRNSTARCTGNAPSDGMICCGNQGIHISPHVYHSTYKLWSSIGRQA